MWIEEAEELFKGYFPYYLLLVLPMFIIISPINPVSAAYEFPVYRMQHYDLHGQSHGCRSASVNLEARSLQSWGTSRHCVVTRIQDLTVDYFRNIRGKAGALLIVYPEDFSVLTFEEKQHLMILEDAMLAQEVNIPVYFVSSTPELEKIVGEISVVVSTEDKSRPATEALFTSIAANGYQIVINPRTPSPKTDIKINSIQGTLPGHTVDGKTSTIAVVAHYDSFGVAPDLSFGADSNASGVVVLLELMRLFSILYADPKTHGKYNIIFLLSGGGKLNYQGSKKWLEDQLDSLDGSIIQDALYVMCLDTLASSDGLYMHVSKPPKDGSPASTYFKELKLAADRQSIINVDGVHKKINLADDLLAWEHERFSIRRLPAFTLSSLKSHKDLLRGTILDTYKNFNLDRLVQHTHLIAEALASHIYNVSGTELFGGSLQIDEAFLKAWIEFLSSQSRSAQLLSGKDNSLINFFKDAFSRYVRDVRVTHVTPDKRDPDFMFYEVTRGVVNIYSVKPAIFDLILTLVIILYLGCLYLFIQKFPNIYNAACSVTFKKKIQ
ncbi:hypothetical protein RI129_002292 [Pyrocoelia pectoralis]|uniref:Nicalin n=1 Tax=Pyrocoelia pectoralis TaxID=417401 RepID=A0AAN7VFR0_9COLE